MPRHDQRQGLAAARSAAQVRQVLLLLPPAPVHEPGRHLALTPAARATTWGVPSDSRAEPARLLEVSDVVAADGIIDLADRPGQSEETWCRGSAHAALTVPSVTLTGR